MSYFQDEYDRKDQRSRDELMQFIGSVKESINIIKKDTNILFDLIKKVEAKLNTLEIDLSVVKTKSAIWGAAVGSAAALFANYMLKRLG